MSLIYWTSTAAFAKETHMVVCLVVAFTSRASERHGNAATRPWVAFALEYQKHAG